MDEIDVAAVVKAVLDLAIACGLEVTPEQYAAVNALADALVARGDDDAS